MTRSNNKHQRVSDGVALLAETAASITTSSRTRRPPQIYDPSPDTSHFFSQDVPVEDPVPATPQSRKRKKTTTAAPPAKKKKKPNFAPCEAPEGKKWCGVHDKGAGAFLPLVQFSVRSSTKTGKDYWCKACQRNSHYLTKYGMTYADFEEMWRKQKGKCACCSQRMKQRKGPKGTNGNLCNVDHKKNTKIVRELLCSSCNHAAGKVFHKPKIAQCLVNYLAKHERQGTL